MAGFPNAAEEAGDEPLNLHRLVVKSPASTYFMRVDGDFHREMGIHSGDVVVVDRSLRMQSGDLVVINRGEDFLLRRVAVKGRRILLVDRSNKQVEDVTDTYDASIWGVVSYTLHDQRGRYIYG